MLVVVGYEYTFEGWTPVYADDGIPYEDDDREREEG